MDTIAHGIWTYIIYFAHPKKWWAVLIGIAPDVISFVPYFIIDYLLGFSVQATFDLVYQYTHSLVIFAIVFIGIALFTRSAPLIFGAWGIHIVFDMFTHPMAYYPTPYLFPFNSPELLAFDYRTWGFLVVNYVLIIGFLLFLHFRKKK